MNKMLFVIGVVLFVFGIFAQPCMARDFADIYTDCGIGAMIAPKNSAVAAVTNVTWDLGTTAISSNISSPDSCQGGKDRVAAFIYQSYDSLEKDLASGYGTYLDAFVELVGCDPQYKQEFVTTLRKDFAENVAASMYTNRTRYQKAEALFDLVYKHVGSVS